MIEAGGNGLTDLPSQQSSQDSETTRKIYVTGFGPFAGVNENPTSWLVSKIQEDTARSGVAGAEVLETSAVGSTQALARLMVREALGVPGEAVWLHFGVHGRAKCIYLESSAYDEADFRANDERGYSPAGQKVLAPVDSRASLHTTIPLEKLRLALSAAGFPVELSNDPGRFVCNHLYCSSLRLCEEARSVGRPWHAVFVHVPPESVLALPELRRAAQVLMETLQKAPLP